MEDREESARIEGSIELADSTVSAGFKTYKISIGH
jgi:hypothetical protein